MYLCDLYKLLNLIIVCGVRVEKDGNRAAKRRLSTSTQDQNSVKKKGTVEPEGECLHAPPLYLVPHVMK